MGAHDEPEAVRMNLATALSEQTVFDPSTHKMYYYVREPCSGTSGDFENSSQGYASEIEFLSELIEGHISIDGLATQEIGLGDTFKVSTMPEY